MRSSEVLPGHRAGPDFIRITTRSTIATSTAPESSRRDHASASHLPSQPRPHPVITRGETTHFHHNLARARVITSRPSTAATSLAAHPRHRGRDPREVTTCPSPASRVRSEPPPPRGAAGGCPFAAASGPAATSRAPARALVYRGSVAGWLEIRRGQAPVTNVNLVGRRVVVGRSPDCDVVLNTTSVSRQHAELIFDDVGWRVRDLGSRNGTGVNGTRVAGERALQSGDVLRIDEFDLVFHAGPAPLRPPRARAPASPTAPSAPRAPCRSWGRPRSTPRTSRASSASAPPCWPKGQPTSGCSSCAS